MAITEIKEKAVSNKIPENGVTIFAPRYQVKINEKVHIFRINLDLIGGLKRIERIGNKPKQLKFKLGFCHYFRHIR